MRQGKTFVSHLGFQRPQLSLIEYGDRILSLAKLSTLETDKRRYKKEVMSRKNEKYNLKINICGAACEPTAGVKIKKPHVCLQDEGATTLFLFLKLFASDRWFPWMSSGTVQVIKSENRTADSIL